MKAKHLPATEMALDQMPSDSQIQRSGQLYFSAKKGEYFSSKILAWTLS